MAELLTVKEVEKIPEATEDGAITRKWQCPECGNTNKAQIREQDDKTRIIYFYQARPILSMANTRFIKYITN